MADMANTIRTVDRSWEGFDRSLAFLGYGSSTNSKRPRDRGSEPGLIVRGKGCRIWDVDGNEYIDFRNSLGPISLGYAVPEIDAAIREQLDDGIVFGHPHPLEGEVAELLTQVIPCAERARFLKTGGEAVAATIKIARNATGRNKIIHCGYNGWLNSLSGPVGFRPEGMAASRPEQGVPQAIRALHLSLPWGDEEPWRRVLDEDGDDVAAVVIACDYAEMARGKEFLPALREMTAARGVLMIMDEIVTGFRVALGGAQEYFGATPDLAVFGKAVANGMPLSAYVGRGDLVDSAGEIGISSTFGGETLSLAAARAAIGLYRERDVIAHLWRVGEELRAGIANIFTRTGLQAEVRGLPVCPVLTFSDPQEATRFTSASYREGVSLYQLPYVNLSHSSADISEALERMERAAVTVSRRS